MKKKQPQRATHLSDKYYSGKRFTIKTYESLKNMPKDDEIYVQEYRLNGKKITDPHIPFANVVKGGKLTHIATKYHVTS